MAVLSVLASLLYFVPALSLGLTVPAPPSAYQKVPKIVMGNDDGWAEANIRQLYYDLDVVGYEVILSAPAYNMSGTGSTDIPLEKIRPMLRNPAEYDSVPAGSPSIGNDTNDPRLNYVASFPVTAVKHGLQVLAPAIWGTGADIVTSGPNVGLNTGLTAQRSGTVGVAAYASSNGVPALAFSGADRAFRPYTDIKPGDISHLYSELAITILTQLLASGKPYLPEKTFLNVNFPPVQDDCMDSDGFGFVLTKSLPIGSGITCGPDDAPMPDESKVVNAGCLVSITAMTLKMLDIKKDASEEVQSEVQRKLWPLLSCYEEY